MLNKFLLVVCSAFALAFSFNASAASVKFDFVAEAALKGEGSAEPYTFLDANGSIVTVKATATIVGGSATAYLDGLSGGNPGGLGACVSFSGTQCNPSNDDNVTYQEAIILTFSHEVSLDTVTFNNGNHVDSYSGTFVLNGASKTLAASYTGTGAAEDVGTVFTFFNPNAGGGIGGDDRMQFYIDTILATTTDPDVPQVPIPAAAWLFGSALLGLVGVARRKKLA